MRRPRLRAIVEAAMIELLGIVIAVACFAFAFGLVWVLDRV